MDEAAVKLLLDQVDATTTRIGVNVGVIGDTVAIIAKTDKTISDEIDNLILAAKGGGVSQALIDQAQAIADKAKANSDLSDQAVAALQAQVPVLQAIADKGAPVVPPPPPPPVIIP